MHRADVRLNQQIRKTDEILLPDNATNPEETAPLSVL